MIKCSAQNNKTKVYQSYFELWDKNAAIRKRPRRTLIDYSSISQIFYPPARQAVVFHPIIIERGDEAIKKILLQSSYHFMKGIAEVETDCIIRFCQAVYNKDIDFNFPLLLRHDMLSIIIDEAHHAYLALDSIDQMQAYTGIKPEDCSNKIVLRECMNKHGAELTGNKKNLFDLLAICIGENTLTQEMFDLKHNKDVHPFFNDIMADHMIDEGRHSKIFRQLLAHAWEQADMETTQEVQTIIPEFIKDYISPELHIDTTRHLLMKLNFDKHETEQILDDTYLFAMDMGLSQTKNPVVLNIISLLDATGVLGESLKKSLTNHGLIE